MPSLHPSHLPVPCSAASTSRLAATRSRRAACTDAPALCQGCAACGNGCAAVGASTPWQPVLVWPVPLRCAAPPCLVHVRRYRLACN